MSFRRPRYSRINREVIDLLNRAGITCPPVPLERVAEILGARIVYSNFDGEISGLLARRDGEVVIGVEERHPLTRQRFTIAHEIGHLVMHDLGELHVDKSFPVRLRSPVSSQAVDVDEIEANAFAAALLMPETILRDEVRLLSVDFEDESQVKQLAQRYGVSAQAMTFRLLNLLGI